MMFFVCISFESTMRKEFLLLFLFLCLNFYRADQQMKSPPVGFQWKTIEDIGKYSEASRTDDQIVEKKEEAIKLDGLSAKEYRNLRDASEKHQFQTEVNRMMKIIINSLYKNPEIFLRELISNASDALQKIHFLSLSDSTVLQSNTELTIRIQIDREHRMLNITDTGIGMTKDDLIKYLGTISKSNTMEFFQHLEQAQKDQESTTMINDLIGQFGLGFYSTFLVADQVIVTTKNNADDQWIWKSDSTEFTITSDPRGNTLGRGTTVSLQLKAEANDYLNEFLLEELIGKYSQFIDFPIYLWKSRVVTEQQTESLDQWTNQLVSHWHWINENKPIWLRTPREVTSDEYNAFYRSLTNEYDDPLVVNHFHVEGEVNFRSIIFISKKAAKNLYSPTRKKNNTIKLYIRRVFISDHFEEMLPKYLSFIYGIIDTDDLLLNVSRESFQESKLIELIKTKLIKKSLEMLRKISDENYSIFWKEYGTSIKLGIMEDDLHRSHLADLLRFYSSTSKEKRISLNEYRQRMKNDQNFFYFISTRSIDEAEKSPFVEEILRRGYEILYLIDPIDQYCLQSLSEYQGKKFHNLAKDQFQLNEKIQRLEIRFRPLLNWLKENFNETINDAKISDRLVRTPMILIAGQYGYDGHLERLARIQTGQNLEKNSIMSHYINQKKIIEINPFHPLIKEFLRRIENDPNNPMTLNFATIILETATLRSGFDLKDSRKFTDRIESLLQKAMAVENEL